MRRNQGPDVEAFHGQRGENRAGLVLGNRFYTYLSEELNLAGKAGKAFVGQKNKMKALCCGNILYFILSFSDKMKPRMWADSHSRQRTFLFYRVCRQGKTAQIPLIINAINSRWSRVKGQARRTH